MAVEPLSPLLRGSPMLGMEVALDAMLVLIAGGLTLGFTYGKR